MYFIIQRAELYLGYDWLRLRCNVRHLKSKSYLKHPEPLANTETTSDLKSHLKLFTLVPTFLQVDAYRTVHPDPI